MYADKVTPSMQDAIDETQRRREKQLAYNKAAGVDPQPLRKKIADITDMLQREDADPGANAASRASQASNAAGSSATTWNDISAWAPPQYSAHWPRLMPVRSATSLSVLVRPGIMSSLPARRGTQNEWITSAERRATSTGRPTGTTSSLASSNGRPSGPV